MENQLQVQNKIKLLFAKITEPNYVMDNYYADGLINKLSNCSDPEVSFLATIPLISDLIPEALDHVETADISVKVFLIRMLAIAAQNELHFAKIFNSKGDEIVKGFREINSPHMKPSLRVAHLELAIAFVAHDSGVAWLIKTGVWKELLNLCNEKITVFVVRQTYKFASTFVWRLNDMSDEVNLRLALSYILKPSFDIDFLQIKSVTREEEDEISKVLEPMLQIMLAVVSKTERIEKYSSLIFIIIREHSLISHLYIMFDRMRREDITLLISNLNSWLGIAKVFMLKPYTPDTRYTVDDFMDVSAFYFNSIQYFIQRRSATLVFDFCNASYLSWNSVWKDKRNAITDDKIDLQNQMLFACLVAPLVYVKRSSQITDERLNEFIVNILSSSCEHTARSCYGLRDLILELDTLSVTLQSVKRLTCLKTHLNNKQANLVFQALFYVLKEYVPMDCSTGEIIVGETFEDSQEKVLVMTYVLDTVLYLVKNHDINWSASLETICLYNVVYIILKRSNLSCKFLVTALNVIALTVKKFLTPNLSLLLEATPGTYMHEIGKLIYMKMHDINWEVRDSALELLLVCTEISYIKFQPFQKQIMENNLINVAATMALNDHEYYVQASALKCIGAASKITCIWDKLKQQFPDIQEQLIMILRNNQEGIVRKEACNVLCEIYQNIKLPSTFKHTLYDHMASSALGDFHWEVQLSALKFWRMVIRSFLHDQGMLDGTFPPVTFSRETRKIVNLNETEIQKRLIRVLEELSSTGCLTVLVKLLNEDLELEIMESALSISTELVNILNQYKVSELLKTNHNEPQSIDEIICYIKDNDNTNMEEDIAEPESIQKSDNVIEGILNADDINLLSKIYERQLNLQSEKSKPSTKPRIKLYKHASPYFFVNYCKSKDFKAVLEQKRKWKEGIRSLPSLLDDVLGIYDFKGECNDLDCY